MNTKDPHLTKTRLEGTEVSLSSDKQVSPTGAIDNNARDTVALEEAGYKDDKGNYGERSTADKVTGDAESLDSKKMQSLHVNEGDNDARQPDPRDQEGEWFDDGVNENNPSVDNELSAEPKSEEINDLNRYATLDNAQSRTLNVEEQHNAVKRAKTNR